MWPSRDWESETALIEKTFGSLEIFEEAISEQNPAAMEFARSARAVLDTKARTDLTAAVEKILETIEDASIDSEYLFSKELFGKVDKLTDELKAWRNRDLELLIEDGIRMLARQRHDEPDDGRFAKSEKVQGARVRALAEAIREAIDWTPPKPEPEEEPEEAETARDLPPVLQSPAGRTSQPSMGDRFRAVFLNRK